MEFEKFDDHRVEYEEIARELLASRDRFTAMVTASDATVRKEPFSDINALAKWLKSIPPFNVRHYTVYDSARGGGRAAPWRSLTFNEESLRAFAAEETIESLARSEYWKAVRASHVAVEEPVTPEAAAGTKYE